MAIQLIYKEHYPIIYELFENSKHSVKIISPFIGLEMAQLLANNMELKPTLEVEIITRFYQEDFIKGVSRIDALETLNKAGAKIYALKGLHTKLYLFDTNFALLGSANFTSGGFKVNHELSLFVINEDEVNLQLLAHFNELLEIIKQSGDFLLTAEKIAEEKCTVNNLANGKNAGYSTRIKFGAEIKYPPQTENIEQPDTIQSIISESVNSEQGGTIWLKFEGSSTEPRNVTECYPLVTIDEFPQGATFFSPKKKPSGVKYGDSIYLAVHCKDEDNHRIIYIVGRGRYAEFNDNNIATNDMISKHGWMEKYPYYCTFIEFEYIDTPIRNTIPLNDVIKNLGSNTYISTTIRSGVDPYRSHRQQAQIRLTNESKKYIDNLFDEIVKKYDIRRLPN